MQTVELSKQAQAALLAELLITPSQEMRSDNMSTTMAGCHPGCSGFCGAHIIPEEIF